MASARSRRATASSNDLETCGTMLRGNRNRREKMIPKESMRLRRSINDISEPMAGIMIEGLGWIFSLVLGAAVAVGRCRMPRNLIFPHLEILSVDEKS